MTSKSVQIHSQACIWHQKYKYEKTLLFCFQPKKQKGPMCQFYEDYNGSYLTYRSVVDSSRYLGFNKFGKPMKNHRGRQECFNFIKYNPHADIDHHNSLVNADMGGMDPRDPYVVSRKPSPVMRATKNSLLQADSTREIVHTTHRYRHPNRSWKRPGEKVSAPRRRLESPLFEANKYWAAHWLADQDCLIYTCENLRSDCQIRWWNVRSRFQEPTTRHHVKRGSKHAPRLIATNKAKLASCVSCSLAYNNYRPTAISLHRRDEQQRKIVRKTRAYQLAGWQSCWLELSLCVVKFHFTLAPTESFQASMHDIIISPPFRSIAKFLIRLVGSRRSTAYCFFHFHRLSIVLVVSFNNPKFRVRNYTRNS